MPFGIANTRILGRRAAPVNDAAGRRGTGRLRAGQAGLPRPSGAGYRSVVSAPRHPLLERVARRTLSWTFFSWYWGDAIAVDGLLEASRAGIPEARAHVLTSLDRWARMGPDSFDDALAPGRAIVELVAEGDLAPAAAERFLASIDRLPTFDGSIPLLEPHRPAFRFGVCIDAVYHLPPALAAAGAWGGDRERVAQAVAIAERAVDLLACPAGWSQWYDAALRRNNGIPWSRGIGWALLGLLDLLDLLAAAGSVQGVGRIQDMAGAMLERLGASQGADGRWRSVLDDDEAACETSTSAFFVAAVHHPAAATLYEPPTAVLESAVAALTSSIDADGICQGVSADILPGWDVRPYRAFGVEPSPWGQGAALRALTALRGAAP